MTGQNKKTQSTKRKNRSSQGEAVQNSNKNTRSSSNSTNAEVEELKQQLAKLQSDVDELKKQNQPQSLDDDDDDNAQGEAESEDSSPPAKRQRKKQYNEEEKAKFVVKSLLDSYPSDLKLKDELIFTNKENTAICEKLIPKLQKDTKAAYDLSYEQLKEWLQKFHKKRRGDYLKSNQNPTSLDNEVDNSQEVESDRSTKRQTKSKGKKPANLPEDDEGAKNEEGLKIEEGAKIIMRTYLDKVSPDLNLKLDSVFTSKENTDICENLIPKLQKKLKPEFNLSHEQVRKWLRSIHQTKRKKFAKANQMDIDQN